ACSCEARAVRSSAGRRRKDSEERHGKPTPLANPSSIPRLLARDTRALPVSPAGPIDAKPTVSEPLPDTLRTVVYSTSGLPGKAKVKHRGGGAIRAFEGKTDARAGRVLDTAGGRLVPGRAARWRNVQPGRVAGRQME